MSSNFSWHHLLAKTSLRHSVWEVHLLHGPSDLHVETNLSFGNDSSLISFLHFIYRDEQIELTNFDYQSYKWNR